MKVTVRVKTNQKTDLVTPKGNGVFEIRVKAPAMEGRANAAVIKLLSQYFHIQKSRIKIIIGTKAKTKLVELY